MSQQQQYITIKNFGPVKHIERLPINDMMILIGEQATGKSTIAKLVYFFRSLEVYIVSPLIQSFIISESLNNDFLDKLDTDIKQNFYLIFGTSKEQDFEITFDFGNTFFMTLKPNEGISIDIEHNFDFKHLLERTEKEYKDYINSDIALKKNLNEVLARIESRIEIGRVIEGVNLFNTVSNLPCYIPAGRTSLMVINQAFQGSYKPDFYFRKKAGNQSNARKTIDYLFDKFLSEVEDAKSHIFFGKTLEDIILEKELFSGKKLDNARIFAKKIQGLLKGEYINDGAGEQIKVNGGRKISFDWASSGQQEVIWIVLYLFALILGDEPNFVIIEEPEAHLYPLAQEELMNLIAFFLHCNPNNQILITTHSPYILTATNNLIFAKQTEEKMPERKEEIKALVGNENGVKLNSVGAYYVYTHSQQARKESKESLFSLIGEDGLINESALDDASEVIMDKFDKLMDIYRKRPKDTKTA